MLVPKGMVRGGPGIPVREAWGKRQRGQGVLLSWSGPLRAWDRDWLAVDLFGRWTKEVGRRVGGDEARKIGKRHECKGALLRLLEAMESQLPQDLNTPKVSPTSCKENWHISHKVYFYIVISSLFSLALFIQTHMGIPHCAKICFYERPTLLSVFPNWKKSEEDSWFLWE